MQRPTKRQISPHKLHGLPAEGFARIENVLQVIPLSKNAFITGIKSGLYPEPVKLGKRAVAWRVEDIRALIKKLGGSQ